MLHHLEQLFQSVDEGSNARIVHPSFSIFPEILRHFLLGRGVELSDGFVTQPHLSPTGKCFDIGNTVRAALERFERSGDPWAGSSDPSTAGNGSLMRLAPIPIFYASDAREAISRAADSSRTTHGAPQAVHACRYFAGLLFGALHGVSKEQLLSERYAPIADLWDREPLNSAIDAVARGSFKHREPPAIRGTGYVVETLEAALWAFNKSSDFRTGALLAANLGDDADTTAAIYGQIAGAHDGLEGIPEKWRNLLHDSAHINELAMKLAQGAAR